METLDLESLHAFNRELSAVNSAGLVLDLGVKDLGIGGPSHDDDSFRKTLDSLAERWELASARGRAAVGTATLGAELQEGGQELSLTVDDAIPPRYVAAFHAWVLGGRSPAAFEPFLVSSTASRKESTRRRLSSMQPLVWMVVGYVALLIVCLFVVPVFESQSLSLGYEGDALRIVSGLRSALPIWGPLVGVSILCIAFWRIRGTRAQQKRSQERRSGSFASVLGRGAVSEQIANLIDRGVPVDQALMLGREQLNRGQASPNTQSDAPVLSSGQNAGLPPLLQWAVSERHASLPPSHAMRIASRMYACIGDLHAERLGSWLPSRLAVVFGGLIVLVVALCVFLPLIEFLLVLS